MRDDHIDELSPSQGDSPGNDWGESDDSLFSQDYDAESAAILEALSKTSPYLDSDLLSQMEADGVSDDEAEEPSGEWSFQPLDEIDDPRPSMDTWTGSDFDDPRLGLLFDFLKDRVRTACKVNTAPKDRERALRWIFVPGDMTPMRPNEFMTLEQCKRGVDFENVCSALGARSTVLRVRTQHQLWKAGIVLPRPLDAGAVSLPKGFEAEIQWRTFSWAHRLAIEIAAYAWDWPSIDTRSLQFTMMKQGVEEDDYHKAIEGLVLSGHLGITNGLLYFIARNPGGMTREQLGRFSFAQSIHFDN